MAAQLYEMADDDLSRQRRKRDERLLARILPEEPTMTVGDLVADVVAASGDHDGGDGDGAEFDVRAYLAERGHDWATIKAVVDYVERRAAPPPERSRPRPLP